MFLAEIARICETAIQYGARYFRGWNKRRFCAHSIMQELRSLFNETQWDITTTGLRNRSVSTVHLSQHAMAFFTYLVDAQITT